MGVPMWVDEGDDSDAADQGDGPAEEHSEEIDRGACEGHDIESQPEGDVVAKDDQNGGERERDERERDEEEGATATLPEGPAIGGEIIGAANAFHESDEDAGRSGNADEKARGRVRGWTWRGERRRSSSPGAG